MGLVLAQRPVRSGEAGGICPHSGRPDRPRRPVDGPDLRLCRQNFAGFRPSAAGYSDTKPPTGVGPFRPTSREPRTIFWAAWCGPHRLRPRLMQSSYVEVQRRPAPTSPKDLTRASSIPRVLLARRGTERRTADRPTGNPQRVRADGLCMTTEARRVVFAGRTETNLTRKVHTNLVDNGEAVR